MKIPRSEFKAVIKECLKELINEGALNNVVSQLIQTQGIPVAQNQMSNMQQNNPTMDPRIQAVAQSVARNGADAKLYEAIFADAVGTMAYQNGVDPQLMMQGNNNMMGNMMPQPQMMNQGYFGGYPQQMMPNQYGMQQPMPMQQQPMMQMQQGTSQQLMLHQQNPQQPQQGGGGGMSRWAQLAYNSPIKNRPDSEGGLTLGNGGSPGSNMGKFD